MSNRILYFRGGILEDADELASDDVVQAASVASSKHRDLTAEVWLGGKKAAVVGPCRDGHLPDGR